MSFDDDTPESRSEIPVDWDVLRAAAEQVDEPAADREPESCVAPVPKINMAAASIADAVTVVAVCTAALLALDSTGYRVGLGLLPWAASLGAVWWTAAAAVLLIVRQGTPGMLLAGIMLSARISLTRVAGVIFTAGLCAILGGLPAVLGARRSPIAAAAGADLVPLSTD